MIRGTVAGDGSCNGPSIHEGGETNMRAAAIRRKGLFSGVYVAPAMILLIMFLIVPLFYSVYCGLYSFKYMNRGEFQGLKNFIYCLTDKIILNSFKTTFIVTFSATGISVIVGMLLALWIDKKHGMFAYSIEMVGLIPWVISMVVASLLWRWLLNGDMGLLGFISNWVGRPIYILEHKGSALIAMIFVMSWRTIGYAMVMLLAGLKSLDPNLLEAAAIDGASKTQTLFKIKLPLILTNFLLSLIVLTVSNFTNNTVPRALTNGGPAYATNVVTLEQYTLSFEYYDFGKASALALLVMLATALIIWAYMKVTKYEL